MYGRHRKVIEERTRRQVGRRRFEAWGNEVDMSSNVGETVYTQKAVQYDKRPDVKHTQEELAAPLIDESDDPENPGLLDDAGIWLMMPRIQRDALALRLMFVRVDYVEGSLSYRAVFPDMVTTTAYQDRPDVPVALRELREYDDPETGTTRWYWDVYDLTDPDKPSYRVVDLKGVDVSKTFLKTDDNPAGDFTGDRYPYRWADGRAFLPWVMYRPVKSGLMYDAWTEAPVFDGTLQAAVFQTMFAHIMRTSSWPQRWGLGVAPLASGTDDEDGDGGGRGGTLTDPAVLLLFGLQEDFEGQGSVGQFKPGADAADFQQAIANYERRVAAMADLSPADIQRTSGDPRSGYALEISREGKREAQVKHEESFRRGDQDLIAKSAAILNRQTKSSFPESGYRLEYRSLPKTAAELQEESEYLNGEVEAGHMDMVTAYQRRHPGISRAQAEADLDKIAEINRRFTGAPAPTEGQEVQEEGAAAVAPEGVEKAQDTALNGAQVQAAQGIVESVALGQLPRASGVEMLQSFFNIPPDQAEAIMGTVGRGFTPTPEAAPAQA